MKKLFTVKIDRINELVSFIAENETYTAVVDRKFKIGEVTYNVAKRGNLFKIIHNNQSIRLYNNLNIILPVTNDEVISCVRKPNNKIEEILNTFNIPLSLLSFSSSTIRIPSKYSLQYSDGTCQRNSRGIITYRSFNWIILGHPSSKGFSIKKIICYDNIVNNSEAIKSLTDKLAFLKKGYLEDDFAEYDADKDVYDFSHILKLILEKNFKISREKTYDLVLIQQEYNCVFLNGIDDPTIITDGIIMSNSSRNNHYDVKDYSYIIRTASLRDGNISYLKNKLVHVILSQKANRGTVYTVQHILSNFPVVRIYDMTMDDDLYDFRR